jgi:hypothetical protein
VGVVSLEAKQFASTPYDVLPSCGVPYLPWCRGEAFTQPHNPPSPSPATREMHVPSVRSMFMFWYFKIACFVILSIVCFQEGINFGFQNVCNRCVCLCVFVCVCVCCVLLSVPVPGARCAERHMPITYCMWRSAFVSGLSLLCRRCCLSLHVQATGSCCVLCAAVCCVLCACPRHAERALRRSGSGNTRQPLASLCAAHIHTPCTCIHAYGYIHLQALN